MRSLRPWIKSITILARCSTTGSSSRSGYRRLAPGVSPVEQAVAGGVAHHRLHLRLLLCRALLRTRALDRDWWSAGKRRKVADQEAGSRSQRADGRLLHLVDPRRLREFHETQTQGRSASRGAGESPESRGSRGLQEEVRHAPSRTMTGRPLQNEATTRRASREKRTVYPFGRLATPRMSLLPELLTDQIAKEQRGAAIASSDIILKRQDFGPRISSFSTRIPADGPT